GREYAAKRRAHALASGVPCAARLGPGAGLEDAVVGHEAHQRVDVVSVPAIEEGVELFTRHAGTSAREHRRSKRPRQFPIQLVAGAGRRDTWCWSHDRPHTSAYTGVRTRYMGAVLRSAFRPVLRFSEAADERRQLRVAEKLAHRLGLAQVEPIVI